MKKAVKNATAVAIPNVDNMPSKVKVYTRTGDAGKTSLYGGKRVPKSYLRVEVYGTIDELNSVIGILLSDMGKEDNLANFFKEVQSDLFSIGANLAGDKTDLNLLTGRTAEMEKLIDVMDKELPELKNFILPGGTHLASLAHLARSVCRRAERKVVSLPKTDSRLLAYLNRLSDLLFITARYLNWKNGLKDTLWLKKK